jgi:hypothetical protein
MKRKRARVNSLNLNQFTGSNLSMLQKKIYNWNSREILLRQTNRFACFQIWIRILMLTQLWTSKRLSFPHFPITLKSLWTVSYNTQDISWSNQPPLWTKALTSQYQSKRNCIWKCKSSLHNSHLIKVIMGILRKQVHSNILQLSQWEKLNHLWSLSRHRWQNS